LSKGAAAEFCGQGEKKKRGGGGGRNSGKLYKAPSDPAWKRKVGGRPVQWRETSQDKGKGRKGRSSASRMWRFVGHRATFSG